jgi:outer membrane protein W
LGQATNPPTAGTTQLLAVPAAARASAAASSRGGKKKAIVLGRGTTKVPSGKTVPVTLKLNGKGRARLAKQGSLKATLTVVATDQRGKKQTTTRAVTVEPAKGGAKKSGAR